MNRSRGELARFLAGPRLDDGAARPPPAILGNRGSPLEAPENSLSGLRRALALGLDGVAYDVRVSRDGGLVLLRDEHLERTTDGEGALADHTLAELSLLDAGAHFHARFQGERLALFEEALALPGPAGGGRAEQLVFVHERGLARAIADTRTDLAPASSVRIVSAVRDVCLEARDAGLSTVLVVRELGRREEDLLREERISALGIPPALLARSGHARDWPGERVGIGFDEPEDLLRACRAPLAAITTNEPQRALAVRALVRLAPADDGPFPIRAPELAITSGAGDADCSRRRDLEDRGRLPPPDSVI